MNIWIDYQPAESQDIIAGARIIDLENRGCIVDADPLDITAIYSVNGGMYPDEAWGQTIMVEELQLSVRTCSWKGYRILNPDDVCWALWERENDQ